jgi:hypothetical protein
MEALAGHDAAVRMIDTSAVRVPQHGTCIADNNHQEMGRSARCFRKRCCSQIVDTTRIGYAPMSPRPNPGAGLLRTFGNEFSGSDLAGRVCNLTLGSNMAAGDSYRTLAARCETRARNENDLAIRHEWEIMARSYRRLAEQAERNARTDVVYEQAPEPKAEEKQQTRQSQAQQQPQSKLEPDE